MKTGPHLRQGLDNEAGRGLQPRSKLFDAAAAFEPCERGNIPHPALDGTEISDITHKPRLKFNKNLDLQVRNRYYRHKSNVVTSLLTRPTIHWKVLKMFVQG